MWFGRNSSNAEIAKVLADRWHLYVLTISIIKGISNHQAVPLLLKILLI